MSDNPHLESMPIAAYLLSRALSGSPHPYPERCYDYVRIKCWVCGALPGMTCKSPSDFLLGFYPVHLSRMVD